MRKIKIKTKIESCQNVDICTFGSAAINFDVLEALKGPFVEHLRKEKNKHLKNHQYFQYLYPQIRDTNFSSMEIFQNRLKALGSIAKGLFVKHLRIINEIFQEI